MLYVLWALVFFSAIIFDLSKSKSKIAQGFILLVIFAFFWIILGWSSGSYDINIGIQRYVDYQSYESFTEAGYTFLITVFHNIGFEYRTFFVMCSFFEVNVILWFVRRNCSKPIIALGLFMFYPMVVYFQYTRNILAFSFVLIGIDCILQKKKFYIYKYVICVLLAASIHFSSLFFLLYLPARLMNRKKVVTGTLIGVILLYMTKFISFIASFLTKYLGEGKTSIILGTINYEGIFGRVFSLCYVIIIFFLVYMLLKEIYYVDMSDDNSNFLVNINILSLLFIPLTLNFGSGFARIPTLLFLLNECFFVNKVNLIRKQRKRIIVYFLIALMLFGSLVINARNLEYRQKVIYPLFEQNELIN